MKKIITNSSRFYSCTYVLMIATILICSSHAFSQVQKGERITVTLSSTVDLKTIEEYSKLHPIDPNEKRIGGIKDGETDGDEEENIPMGTILPNAKINVDPFGKMQPSATLHRDQSLNSVSQITTFNGIDDINSTIPPDVGGQVGPNHVMTTLNSFVRIANRAGTTISTVTLNAFFATVGSPNVFDPKVIYDPFNNRWIITACANAVSSKSALLLGISATSDPTGIWKLYSIDADASNVSWFDYPSIGFNKDWVVISGNMFPISSGSFFAKTFIFSKSDLYAAASSPVLTVINSSGIGGTLVPAITYDDSISTLYLTQTANGNFSGNGFIAFFTITGAIGSEVLTGPSYISTPNTWSDNGGVTNSAPQAGTASKVANNDTRMQKTIFRNGSIWCTHSIFLPAAAPNRTGVQWWQLTTAGAVMQRGRIEDPTSTNFYAFPSIDVNQNNDVMIGCAKFSATTFPSACYAVRLASDPVNTFQSDVVYKAGLAKYFKTFGGSSNRWGDYTSVCVDPNNDLDFWTVQEYSMLPLSATVDLWGTWWAGVCITLPIPSGINSVGGAELVCPGKTKSYKITAIAGATSYTWTPPIGANIVSGQGTNAITVNYTAGFIATDTLRVVANNACGASPERKLTIKINKPTLPSVVTGQNYGVCNAMGIPYSVTNVAGMTYSWSFNTTLANVASGQGSNAINANFLSGYTSAKISVTAGNACGTSSARSLTIRSLTAAPAAITGTSTVCSGQIGVPYSIDSVKGASAYVWTAPVGSHVSDGIKTSAANTLTTIATSVTVNYGSTAGNLIVKGKNSCGFGANKNLPITFNCLQRESKTTEVKAGLNLVLSPNPTNNLFTLIARSSSNEPLTVRVMDATGRIAHEIKGRPNQSFTFGDGLLSGLYMVEVRQGKVVKTIKAVKE